MSKYRIEIKWAIIFSVATILWMLGQKYFRLYEENISQHAFTNNFFGIIAIGIYLLGLYNKRQKHYRGYLTWPQGFRSGLVLTLGILVLYPFVQLLLFYVIAPNYLTQAAQYAVVTKEMTSEQAATNFQPINYMGQTLLWVGISGVITSAIVALLLRRRVANPHQVKGTTPYR